MGLARTTLVLFAVLWLNACGDPTLLTPTSYSSLPGWQNDAPNEALRLFQDACAVNATRSNAYRSKTDGAIGDAHHWQRVCRLASEIPNAGPSTARTFFEENFTPHKVETSSKSTGTLTGYYEPLLRGSRKAYAPYVTPVYGVPSDLGSRQPYFTREEIEGGALRGRAPVLLYVDDPVMLFFLHIQGSGKVRLPDGSLIGLQYAAQNGHAFVPIGRILKEMGEMPQPSMQGIRDWLYEHPKARDALMNQNPSYIFFKLSPGDEMAKGALGIPLTPLRSLAVDDDRAAYGVPTYLDTYMTEFGSRTQIPLQRLFVSQDTGGALKGPHRGDIFFGRGEREEWQAGHQNAQGDVYWLLPVDAGITLKDGLPYEPSPETPSVVLPEPAEQATP